MFELSASFRNMWFSGEEKVPPEKEKKHFLKKQGVQAVKMLGIHGFR